MKRDTIVILLLLAAGAGWLAYRYRSSGVTTGLGYLAIKSDGIPMSVPMHAARELKDATFSWPRTVGIWAAGFFTLAIFSFLYRDNPIYKIAEAAFVGISAAYWMTVGFWAVLVPNLAGKLFPRLIKFGAVPGLDLDKIVEDLARTSWFGWGIDYESANGDGLTAAWWQLMNLPYWLPMILGAMLLWRLAPKGAWIARWPLAFIIGSTVGFRLVGFLGADFVAQIKASIAPLYVPVYDATSGALDFGRTFYQSMNNVLLLAGSFCALLYFFFSLEHKGLAGKVSRVGIWVLMITFGAGFGYTVMGRIALLVGRFEFLVSDWLNVVAR